MVGAKLQFRNFKLIIGGASQNHVVTGSKLKKTDAYRGLANFLLANLTATKGDREGRSRGTSDVHSKVTAPVNTCSLREVGCSVRTP